MHSTLSAALHLTHFGWVFDKCMKSTVTIHKSTLPKKGVTG